MNYRNFSDIPYGRYGLIMADPPWSFTAWSAKGDRAKGAKAHYACTPLDWIKALPVADVATPDCLLWLWATNPMLPDAIETLRAWGFTYKTAGHWVKRAQNGNLAFGTGYILRCAGEPFLIGTRGKPNTRAMSRSVRSVVEGPRREHSRKPDEAYAAAEALCGGATKLDLFSRQPRDGWDQFGNESTLYTRSL